MLLKSTVEIIGRTNGDVWRVSDIAKALARVQGPESSGRLNAHEIAAWTHRYDSARAPMSVLHGRPKRVRRWASITAVAIRRLPSHHRAHLYIWRTGYPEFFLRDVDEMSNAKWWADHKGELLELRW